MLEVPVRIRVGDAVFGRAEEVACPLAPKPRHGRTRCFDPEVVP